MPRLEDWSITGGFNPYQPPECQHRFLQGIIYDDEKKRFPDGSPVRTSILQDLDLKNNIAQTRNTTYILGSISEDYLKWLREKDLTIEQFVK